MSYTKTDWLEHSMSTAEKLDALDNLEGLYAEAVAYIDAISHLERYYTEAEASAKYFTTANDGTGSGLICVTLDGYTAQEIIDAGTPSGCIGLWSGSEATIPAGWYLCNGLHGTPDLRDCFVVGAGGHYEPEDTGGSNYATTDATVTIGATTLTAAQIPKHTHGTIIDYYNANITADSDEPDIPVQYLSLESLTTATGETGGGGSHTHDGTWTGSEQSKMPPYYALCRIMRA